MTYFNGIIPESKNSDMFCLIALHLPGPLEDL